MSQFSLTDEQKKFADKILKQTRTDLKSMSAEINANVSLKGSPKSETA